MIAGLKPYGEYNDSGLPWLGEVPSHWEVRRIKTVLREVDRRSAAGREPLLSLRMQAGLVDHHASGGRPIPPSALVGYKRVLPGEIVMNRMRASSGLFAAATTDGLVSPDYAIFRPVDQINVAYLVGLFRTPAMMAVFRLESTGLGTGESGFLRLYSDQFGRLAIPTPPAAEQAAIVRFLDWANGRLDRTIRAKRKVIALLTEQKQATIHRATTRGLNSNVALKPSGVPWLGDIPQHWDVRKLKHVTQFVNGLPFKPGDWKAEGVPIIRIQNLNGSEVFNYTNRKGLPAALLIQPGELMFAWSGNRGTSFGSFEWTKGFAGYLNQHIFKLFGYTLPKRYFYYVLRAVTRHVEEQAGGIIGLVHVTKPELGSVVVPLAPHAEAEAIARYIDLETEAVDRVIGRLNREIGLLREYRTQLIADVVTGKLDVRDAIAQLPKEAATSLEAKPADEADDSELTDEEAAEA